MARFMLKTFAQYLRFKWSLFVFAAFMAAWVISISMTLAKIGDTTTGPILFAIWIIILLLTVVFDFFITYLPSAQRRQQAMQGTLAEEFFAVQPKPDAKQLQMPAEIVLYDGSPQGVSFKLMFFMSFLAAQIIPLICVVFILFALLSLHNFPVGAIGFIFLIVTECGVITLFVWLMRRDQRIVMQVTADGLTKRYLGWRIGSIRWEDARLFALVTQRDAQTKGLTYELAGDKGSLTWREIWEPYALLWLSESAIDKQNGQIAALNALVVARTGLKLYDLRDRSRGRSL